jgi:hypothetical protein
MFPQTYHVESVVALTRSGEAASDDFSETSGTR